MYQLQINYLAVLISGIAGMAIGAFWYSSVGFGKQWMAWSGLNEVKMEETKKKGMAKLYAIAFIGTLVMSYVLACFIGYANVQDLAGGLAIGFWVWLGFVATKSLGSVLWEGRPVKLYALNVGYDLVSLLVMAAIITSWR